MTDLLLFCSDDAQTRATLAPSGLPACLPACHPAGDLGRATSLLEKDSTSHMCVYVFFFSSYRSTQGKKCKQQRFLTVYPRRCARVNSSVAGVTGTKGTRLKRALFAKHLGVHRVSVFHVHDFAYDNETLHWPVQRNFPRSHADLHVFAVTAYDLAEVVQVVLDFVVDVIALVHFQFLVLEIVRHQSHPQSQVGLALGARALLPFGDEVFEPGVRLNPLPFLVHHVQKGLPDAGPSW